MPMHLPYYHLAQHPPCPLPQATTIGGELPLWTMGARQQHLRLARGSADSVCVRGCRYLHAHTRAGKGGRRSKEMGGPVDLFMCVCMSCISLCVCELCFWCMYVCLCAWHFLCVVLCVYVRVHVVFDSLRELA